VLFIDTHEADGAAAPEKMMDALTMRSHNALSQCARARTGPAVAFYCFFFMAVAFLLLSFTAGPGR
jgi:hypothetical protein